MTTVPGGVGSDADEGQLDPIAELKAQVLERKENEAEIVEILLQMKKGRYEMPDMIFQIDKIGQITLLTVVDKREEKPKHLEISFDAQDAYDFTKLNSKPLQISLEGRDLELSEYPKVLELIKQLSQKQEKMSVESVRKSATQEVYRALEGL